MGKPHNFYTLDLPPKVLITMRHVPLVRTQQREKSKLRKQK